MKIGSIKMFDETKGYGFILVTFREQFFVHVSNYLGDVAPVKGLRVEFEVGPAHKEGQQPQAINVRPVEDIADLLGAKS